MLITGQENVVGKETVLSLEKLN